VWGSKCGIGRQLAVGFYLAAANRHRQTQHQANANDNRQRCLHITHTQRCRVSQFGCRCHESPCYFILLACNMRCCVTVSPCFPSWFSIPPPKNPLQHALDKANTINERRQRLIVFIWSGRTALHWQVCRLLLIYPPTKCCISGLCAVCHFIISSIFFYA